MSRYIATRALRGANALVNEAEIMLHKALAEKGPEAPVSFPNTAYYLPIIYGITGEKVEKLSDMEKILQITKTYFRQLVAIPAPTWPLVVQQLLAQSVRFRVGSAGCKKRCQKQKREESSH